MKRFCDSSPYPYPSAHRHYMIADFYPESAGTIGVSVAKLIKKNEPDGFLTFVTSQTCIDCLKDCPQIGQVVSLLSGQDDSYYIDKAITDHRFSLCVFSYVSRPHTYAIFDFTGENPEKKLGFAVAEFIKKQFPDSRISFFTLQTDKSGIEKQPYIDTVTVLSDRGKERIKEILFREAGAYRFKKEGFPKHILWVRPDGIGDNVIASSMLPHIRREFGQAKLSILCQEHVAQLYESCPFADEIITFNRSSMKNKDYWNALITEIQNKKPDLSINSVYSRDKTADFFALSCGAEERIGFYGDLRNITHKDRDNNNPYYTKLIPENKHLNAELDRYIFFLKHLGIDVPHLAPTVWLKKEDREFADNFFRSNHLLPEKTIAMFTGARAQLAHFTGYGKALSRICKEHDFSVIALGDDPEYAVNQKNLDDTGVKTFNLSGRKTTLRQCAAIIEKCRLAVGAETGFVQMACALQTPNVVLLGGGFFGRFVPCSPLTSVVCLPLECLDKCENRCVSRDVCCINGISLGVLEEAIHQTLESYSEKPRIFVQGNSLWRPNPGQPKWKQPYEKIDKEKVDLILIEAEQIKHRLCLEEKMHNIMLSICMPTRNRFKYLEQTFLHLEFVNSLHFPVEIVICDGSEGDDTKKLADRMSDKLPIRYFHEKKSSGYEQAVVSAFRAARGKYSVYLGDEDRLMPEQLAEHIAFMEQNPHYAACYSPWELWNDINKTAFSQFFYLDKIYSFQRANSLELFNLILSRHIMPETAVYRTDSFQKVLYAPRKNYWATVWLFHLLKYGEVCFHPKPFHRVTVQSELDQSTGRMPIGNTMAINYLDRYRGSLETALFMALENAALPINQDTKISALDAINQFLNARVNVAARLSRGQRDFIGANELHIRNLLWQQKIDTNAVIEWEKQVVPMAAIQAVAHLFDNTIAELKKLVLCEFANPEGLINGFRSLYPHLPAEVMTSEQIISHSDRMSFMVLTEKEESRKKLVNSGLFPGFVTVFQEIMNNFGILPRRFMKSEIAGGGENEILRQLADKYSYKPPLAFYQTPIGNYYLPTDAPNDVIIAHMKNGKIFEPEIVEVSKRYIKEGTAVLDIGANFGQMSLLFSQFAGDKGQVLSFEADEYIFYILKKNIIANNRRNIIAYNKAVYDKSGKTMFYPVQDFKRFSAYGSYGLDPNATKGRSIDTVSVDDLNIQTPISFMKVDIQGSDIFALRGAVETIKKNQMPILFEFEEQFQQEFKTSWNDYLKFIEEIGYKTEEVINKINYLILPVRNERLT